MDTEVKSSSSRRKGKKGSREKVPAERTLLGRLVQRALKAIVPAAPTIRTAPLVEALEPRVLLSGNTVVPRVDGRIDVPGEVDKYSFNLKNDVRIVFDSLTPNSNLQWSHDGPTGAVVPPKALEPAERFGPCRLGGPMPEGCAVPRGTHARPHATRHLAAGSRTRTINGLFRRSPLTAMPTPTP